MSVGRNIRQKRKERGLTQGKLAEMIGVSDAQISNIERGKRKTSYERLVQIAKVLDCNVSDLYDADDKEHLDDAYIMFAKDLKRDGIDPDDARRWIELARKIINDK